MRRDWLVTITRLVGRRRDRRPSKWDGHGKLLSAASQADATTGAAPSAPTAPTRRTLLYGVSPSRGYIHVPPDRPGLERHDAARRADVCRLFPLAPTGVVVRQRDALALHAMSEPSGCRPPVLTLALGVAVVCPLTPAASSALAQMRLQLRHDQPISPMTTRATRFGAWMTKASGAPGR